MTILKHSGRLGREHDRLGLHVTAAGRGECFRTVTRLPPSAGRSWDNGRRGRHEQGAGGERRHAAPHRAGRRHAGRSGRDRPTDAWARRMAELGKVADHVGASLLGASPVRCRTRAVRRGDAQRRGRRLYRGRRTGGRRSCPSRWRSSSTCVAMACRHRRDVTRRGPERPGHGRPGSRRRARSRATASRRRWCGSWPTASWCSSTSPGPTCNRRTSSGPSTQFAHRHRRFGGLD